MTHIMFYDYFLRFTILLFLFERDKNLLNIIILVLV